jgi:hypothetical protein
MDPAYFKSKAVSLRFYSRSIESGKLYPFIVDDDVHIGFYFYLI